jgi:4-amino-4-deoxy-L-arabinose transferase-like glycosyltransferase
LLQQNQSATYGIRLSSERHAILLAAIAIYFIVNFLARMALPVNLELDEAEQSYFSQWLMAGYSSQPPLYNWLQYATVQLFGLSLASLSASKNLILFSAYVFYFLAAREVMRDRQMAVVAVLGLLTIPQVVFEAQRDLSHTVATIFTASLFLYAFLRTVRRPSISSFLLLGFATGVGVIAKYNFVLLPAAAFLAILSDARWRLRLFDWRLLLAGGVAIVIVAPHALWLVDHISAASAHTMRKLTGSGGAPALAMLNGLGSLALASLGFGGLTLALFALTHREKLPAIIRARSDWTRLTGRILIFALGLIVLMILFGGVEKVRDRWLTPILILLPLYLALKIDAAAPNLQLELRRIWAIAIALMVLIPTLLLGRVATASLTGLYQYPNYPFASMAEEVRSQVTSAPTLVVTLDTHMAGNLRLHLQPVPVLALSTPAGLKPPPTPDHQRILFAWRSAADGTSAGLPQKFEQYLQERGMKADASRIRAVTLPYAHGRAGDEYHFAYAVFDLGR